MSGAPHVPVLLDVAVELLAPAPHRRIVDGTFGFGGHTRELLSHQCKVLGLDLDADALAAGRRLEEENSAFQLQHRSFRDTLTAVQEAGWGQADGILLDLGVSSLQLDEPTKGFSYRADGPLDLRFDQQQGVSAAELIDGLEAPELADIFFQFGEERGSRRIASAVKRAHAEEPVDTTTRLREVVQSVAGHGPQRNATLSRVFQALRIAVNDELGALTEVLDSAADALAPGGRLVVISYHSLEDRLVKRWLATASKDCVCPPRQPICNCNHIQTFRSLTRRLVKADEEEIRVNPRARSAKLRAAERLP